MRLGVIGGIFGENGQANTVEESANGVVPVCVSELLAAVRAVMARAWRFAYRV